MKLHASTSSPFARKVRALILEADLSEAVEFVPVSGTPLDSGTIPVALNPLAKLPVLERLDGPALYDSRVICRYLDAHAKAGLYPEPPRLWETLTLEATADGMMEAALSIVYEGRVRPDDKQYAVWTDAQWGKIIGAATMLEERWLSQLQGRFSMAHIGVACALGYLDLRLGERDWRQASPGLANWYSEISTRPCLADTAP